MIVKNKGQGYANIEELEAARPCFGWAPAFPGEHDYDELGTRWYIAVNPTGPEGNEGIGRIDENEHRVQKHQDGTITVDPSLDMKHGWHGYLKHGVFEAFQWTCMKWGCHNIVKGNDWHCQECQAKEAVRREKLGLLKSW